MTSRELCEKLIDLPIKTRDYQVYIQQYDCYNGCGGSEIETIEVKDGYKEVILGEVGT